MGCTLYIMVLGYLFYSGIGWRFDGFFHLLRRGRKWDCTAIGKFVLKNFSTQEHVSGPHHGGSWNKKTSLTEFMLQSRKRVLHPVSHYITSALRSACERLAINPKHQQLNS